ncbi:MAG: prepilin-type N-terminal cleavage/methylation domain-containing protein [Pseudomonadales bacterium]|nr:prepilin-type N-terminal cleavage/methylation domain-containing protein [Pseudomonadales bacterium]
MTPISSTETSRGRFRRVNPAKGFTLLELLIVLTLIGLALGLTIPALTGSDRGSFRGEVRKAVATLTYARRAAIVGATPWTASLYALDPTSADYRERKDALARKTDAPLTTRWVSEVVGFGFQRDARDNSEAAASVEFTFFPQGGSTGGILTLLRAAESARVRVDPITGRITTAYGGEDFNDAF